MCCVFKMTAIRKNVFITLTVLLQLVYNGYAIKCFVCDSTDNPSCADLKSNSSLHAEDCSLENMKSINSWLFDLNKLSFYKTTAYSSPLFTCQKVVARDPIRNEEVTARFCQLHTAGSDACVILQNRMLRSGRGSDSAVDGRRNKLEYVGVDHEGGGGGGGSGGSGGANNQHATQGYIHCSICYDDSCNASVQLLSWKRNLLFLLALVPLMVWQKHLTCW